MNQCRNSSTLGRYVFQVRNGNVSTVPDAGSSLMLLGVAALGFGWLRRRAG